MYWCYHHNQFSFELTDYWYTLFSNKSVIDLIIDLIGSKETMPHFPLFMATGQYSCSLDIDRQHITRVYRYFLDPPLRWWFHINHDFPLTLGPVTILSVLFEFADDRYRSRRHVTSS